MREILEILKEDGAITRENYKKIKKNLTPDMLEQVIFNKFTLIDYIMLKDFDSAYNRRDFVEYIFSLEEVSDTAKLNTYLKMLLLGVESCFIEPNRNYDPNLCSVAYLKVGKRFDKQVFRDSRDLALIFSKFVPSLATTHQKGIDAKRKAIAKKIILNGLVSENYEQIINPDSNKRGIEDIIKYLMISENYGTILKLFEDKIFEVNEDNYELINSTIINEYINKKFDSNTRYNKDDTKEHIIRIQKVLENNLIQYKNKTK